MNEKALQDAYNMFASNGYSGSIDEFQTLINSNPDALNDSFELFTSGGYSGDFDAYKSLIGVKKKPSPSESLQSGLQDVMESDSEDGSLDSPDEPIVAPPIGVETPAPEPNVEEVQQSFVIDGTEVDQETFIDYSDTQSQLNKETKDPFAQSIKLIDGEMIERQEEAVVPLMNYNFNQYGFTFEQTGIDDAMNVTAANGEKLSVELDPIFGINKKSEAEALKVFLAKNKAASRRLMLEEKGYSALERKIQGQDQIDLSAKLLNIEANAFNTTIQQYLAEKNEVQRLREYFSGMSSEEMNLPENALLFQELQQKSISVGKQKQNIISRDLQLKQKGASIDALTGDYFAMKADQGTYFGATINEMLTTIGRRTASEVGLGIDAAVEFSDTGLAGEKAFRDIYAGLAQQKYGLPSLYEKPQNSTDKEGIQIKKSRFKNWDDYTARLTKEQRNELTAATKDILKKDAKFNMFDYDKQGRAVMKSPGAGYNYSDAVYQAWKADPNNKGMVDFGREGAEELWGDSETTPEFSKQLKKDSWWATAYLGAMETIPDLIAWAGPGKSGKLIAAGQRTAQLVLSSYDHTNEQMRNNPNFNTISENEKMAVALPLAITVGTLERIGFRNMRLGTGFVNKVFVGAIGKSTKRNLSKYTFPELVRQTVQPGFKGALAKGGATLAAAGAAEFETGVAQEAADIIAKTLYNNYGSKSDEVSKMFYTPETMSALTLQLLNAGALEMVGGFMLSAPGAMSNAASSADFTKLDDGMFEVFEAMTKDQGSKPFTILDLKSKINDGTFTKKQAKYVAQQFNELQGVYGRIPSDYNTAQKKIALGLLLSKQRLETEIAGKDPATIKGRLQQISDIDTQLEALSRNAFEAAKNPVANAEQDDDINNKKEKYKDSQIPTSQQKFTVVNDNGDTVIVTVTTNLDGSRNITQELEDGTSVGGETISKDNTLTNEDYVTNAYGEVKQTEEVDIKTVRSPKIDKAMSARQRAIISLKEQGIKNPTEEQIKTEQDVNKKPSTETVVKEESTTVSEEVGDNVSQPEPSREGDSTSENSNENRVQTQEEIDQEVSDLETLLDPEVAEDTEINEAITKGKKGKKKVLVEDTTNENTELEGTQIESNLFVTTDDGAPKTTLQKLVLRQAKRAAKSMAKRFPKVNIIVHNTRASYEQYLGYQVPEGTIDRGTFNPNDNTIHINLQDTTKRLVGHEIFHAILYNSIKAGDKAINGLTKKMIQALSRSGSLSKKLKTDLENFASSYESNEKNEEKLAEIFGRIAGEYKNLNAKDKGVIRRFLERIATKFGIEIGQSSQDVIDLLNRLAGKIATGETITDKDIEGLTNLEQGTVIDDGGVIPNNIDLEGAPKINLKTKKSKYQINRGGIDIDKIKRGSINDLSGANAFVFAGDKATYGEIKSPTGLKFDFFGGYLYPYGTGIGWAATNEKSANQLKQRIDNSDGIGLVMSQENDGIAGSYRMFEYLNAEIAHAINKGASPQELLTYVNSKLKVGEQAAKLKKLGLPTQITSLEELNTLMPFEGNNSFSYVERGSFVKQFFSAESLQKFGIPPLNKTAKSDVGVLDYVNDPSLTEVGYGDIVSAIQFEKGAKIREVREGEPNFHPSYPFVLEGKPIMVFNEAPDIRKVFPKSKGKSKTANQTPIGQRAKPQAARSAMGGQYTAPVPGNVETEGAPKIAKKTRESANKLGDLYNMSSKGFFDVNINIGPLRTAARNLGLTVVEGRIREGFRRGELTGYFLSDGIGRNGKPRLYNPRVRGPKKSMQQIGDENQNIVDVVRIARENNFTDNTIITYLRKAGKKVSEIKPILEVQNFVLQNVPSAFGNIEGGMAKGITLFNKVYNFRKKLLDNNITPIGKKIIKAQNEIDQLEGELKINETNKQIAKAKAKLKKLQDEAKAKGKGLYKLTQSEIDNKTLDFLESTQEYKNESDKGKFTNQQAQMLSQMMNAFNGSPMRGDAAGRIRLARQILRERKKGEKGLQKLKKDLRNYIRMALEPDVFSIKDVNDLIKKVTDADSKNIENIKEEVLEFVNKKTNENLTKKINKILNGKYVDISGGRKLAYKVSDEIAKRLENIKNLIGGINSKTDANTIIDLQQKLGSKISEIEKESFQTDEQRVDAANLQIVLNFINAQLMMDYEVDKTIELASVIEDLNALVETGKSALEQQRYIKHMQYVEDAETAYFEITGKKLNLYIENPEFDELLPESKANPRKIRNPKANNILAEKAVISAAKRAGLKKRVPKIFSNANRAVKNFLMGNLDLASLVSTLSRIPGELFGGKLQEISTFKIDEGTLDYKRRKMETTIMINLKLQEVYGKNWQSQAQNDSKAYNTGIMFEGESGLTELVLSQNQMSYLVNQYKDPANVNSFEKKYPGQHKKIMTEMEAKLNDRVRELGRWQVEEFFPAMYETYNEAYKKVYRTSMPWNQYYAGRIYRENLEQTEAIDLLSQSKGAYKNMAAPASTKVRLDNAKPIADVDQMNALLTYVNDMNWFAAMSEPINDLSKMFNNVSVRQAITNAYGKGGMTNVNDMIEKIANRGVKSETGLDWINGMTSAFVIGKLAINPTIFIKQLTSFPAYAASPEVGFRKWTATATMNAPKLISTWKEIQANSVYVQDRYGERILNTIETYAPSKVESLVPSPKLNTLVSVMMYLVKQGDKGAIIIGGVPNYIIYKNNFIKANPKATEQQAIDYAIKRFERDTKRAQQSSDLQDKDRFQTGGTFQRALNMFQTSIKQYMRKEFVALLNLKRKVLSGGKQGKGTVYQNLRTLAVYHTMLPVIFQYVASGFPGLLSTMDDDDKDDLLRAGLLGNLNAIFIIGALFDGTADLISGKPWAGAVSSLPILEQSAKAIEQLAKARKYNVTPVDKNGKLRSQESIDKSIAGAQAQYKKALYTMLGLGGLPAIQVDRLVNNLIELGAGGASPEEMILRILQFSDYAIKSNEDREAERKGPPKVKPLTRSELKKYRPEMYKKQMERERKLKERRESNPSYQRLQELKRQQKERREQMLQNRFN